MAIAGARQLPGAAATGPGVVPGSSSCHERAGAGPASPTPEGRLQRSRGVLELRVEGCEDGARIAHIYQGSPLRILFPERTRDHGRHGVLVNTAGGIAGGDRHRIAVEAHGGASVALTSQAAERVYRAVDVGSSVETTLAAHGGAALAWLPQETIVFNGARLRRATTLDVGEGSEALALETLVFGRAASGETLDRGEIFEGWTVRVGGRLEWADRFRLDDAMIGEAGRSALLGPNRALATLVYVGPQAEARVLAVRRSPPVPATRCLATQVGRVMVVRIAAHDARYVKQALRQVLRPLGAATGGLFQTPRVWPS